MKMATGDLKPDLKITLDDDGTPIDLTGLTLEVHIEKPDGTVVDRAATGDAQGVVTMVWQAGDTDQVGSMRVDVEITWPGPKPQTIRLDDYVTIYAGLA